jgi:hypothetical protein
VWLRRWRTLCGLALILVLFTRNSSVTDGSVGTIAAQDAGTGLRFAVIGDFGSEGQPAAEVGRLVASWNPDLVVTTGDNNYPDGAASTIDANIGQYYHRFIAPYKGGYGTGAAVNRFFPSLGNHDWDTADATPYLDYFTLPGNERYYDFVRGPVHFYIIDSDAREPDGVTANSKQASWLRERLASTSDAWKLVVFHHPAYSSGEHGSTEAMQWPFVGWGASAVLNGHDHDYERIVHNGFLYLVDGLGGRSTYGFGEPVAGSVVRYDADFGALLVDAGDLTMKYRFITRQGRTIDTYVACREWQWRPGESSCVTAGNGARGR